MTFTGFGQGATGFFTDLAANNSREWWLANKARYDAEVRGPLEALLEDLAPEFGEAKVFRPNRDTRFSKDKSPYKTAAATMAAVDGGGAVYLSLPAEGLHVGGGAYELQRDQLARYRDAVDDDRSGQKLVAVAQELRDANAAVESKTTLKTAPRGYGSDHPRIELLRQDGIIGMWAHPPRAWLHTKQAADRVAEHWRALAPLNRWIADNIGPTTITHD